jgi:WD40 repeat protein
MAFSPDGQVVAVSTTRQDKTVGPASLLSLWRVADGTLWRTLVAKGSSYRASGVAFSPDGQLLATAHCWDIPVLLWRTIDGACVRALTLPTQPKNLYNFISTCAAFSPDGRLLATGTSDGDIYLWAVEDGTLLHTVRRRPFFERDSVNDLTFAPNGQLLVSGWNQGSVRVWPLEHTQAGPAR